MSETFLKSSTICERSGKPWTHLKLIWKVSENLCNISGNSMKHSQNSLNNIWKHLNILWNTSENTFKFKPSDSIVMSYKQCIVATSINNIKVCPSILNDSASILFSGTAFGQAKISPVCMPRRLPLETQFFVFRCLVGRSSSFWWRSFLPNLFQEEGLPQRDMDIGCVRISSQVGSMMCDTL